MTCLVGSRQSRTVPGPTAGPLIGIKATGTRGGRAQSLRCWQQAAIGHQNSPVTYIQSYIWGRARPSFG